MKAFYLGLLILAAGVSLAATTPHTEKDAGKRSYSIGISQIVEHPSLNQIRQGMIDALKKEGFSSDLLRINYVNAQGDMVTSNQIARKLSGDKHDVLVGITTPSAQGLVATKTKTPIVFSGVNDPIAAKLLKNLQTPEANVTGVVLASPVKEQVALILEVLPQAKKIAIIYNAGEVNSVSIAEQFHAEVKARGCQSIASAITSSAQVQAATKSLVGRVDAVYLPTDNTVISAIGTILQIGAQEHLPIFAADTASVEAGALAALGHDHHSLGMDTGLLVARLLRGEKVAQLPVVVPTAYELHLNTKFARAMGVEFSPHLRARAQKIHY